MKRRPGRRAAATALALALLAAHPGEARAQYGDADRWQDASWVDDLNFAGANALVGGLAGGLIRHFRGGSFSEGFARGALGGGIAYVGKRTAAARFSVAGLLGREIGAVGASITRSAAFGSGMLDTLVLPIGPARLYLPRGSAPGRWFLRLDLTQTADLVYALQEDRLDFDLGRSLSAGFPVFLSARLFRVRGDVTAGVTSAGFVALSDREGPIDPRLAAHERVHVLQADFRNIVFGLPLEDWVARKVRFRSLPLARYVDVGQGGYPVHLLTSARLWSRSESLLEVEADFLEVR